MIKFLISIIFVLFFCSSNAQHVEIQANYNDVGDCLFSAYNNAKTPMFLKIDFADLQNTSFPETLPYIKMLDPGFNSLFTLERNLDADVPRFNYDVKTYRSNPTSIVNLDFPYLIPFKPGAAVKPNDVENIEGFWGAEALKSWVAVGFKASPGDEIYASRQGTVVEIAGRTKEGESLGWYNTWTNAITLLQPDGTLICYKNVKGINLKLNQKIHPGELLGELVLGADELILLLYQNSLNSDDLRFIIPQFAVSENEIEIPNLAKEYTVIHPISVRALEMTKKEKKKILGLKR